MSNIVCRVDSKEESIIYKREQIIIKKKENHQKEESKEIDTNAFPKNTNNNKVTTREEKYLASYISAAKHYKLR